MTSTGAYKKSRLHAVARCDMEVKKKVVVNFDTLLGVAGRTEENTRHLSQKSRFEIKICKI
jgi:hypothetical protein